MICDVDDVCEYRIVEVKFILDVSLSVGDTRCDRPQSRQLEKSFIVTTTTRLLKLSFSL